MNNFEYPPAEIIEAADKVTNWVASRNWAPGWAIAGVCDRAFAQTKRAAQSSIGDDGRFLDLLIKHGIVNAVPIGEIVAFINAHIAQRAAITTPYGPVICYKCAEAEERAASADEGDEFTVADPDLNSLLNLSVSMTKAGGNHDVGMLWSDLLECVQARLAPIASAPAALTASEYQWELANPRAASVEPKPIIGQAAGHAEPVAWLCVNRVTNRIIWTTSATEAQTMLVSNGKFWTVTPLGPIAAPAPAQPAPLDPGLQLNTEMWFGDQPAPQGMLLASIKALPRYAPDCGSDEVAFLEVSSDGEYLLRTAVLDLAANPVQPAAPNTQVRRYESATMPANPMDDAIRVLMREAAKLGIYTSRTGNMLMITNLVPGKADAAPSPAAALQSHLANDIATVKATVDAMMTVDANRALRLDRRLNNVPVDVERRTGADRRAGSRS